MIKATPVWLEEHRNSRPYHDEFGHTPVFSGAPEDSLPIAGLARTAQTAFNNHDKQTGAHISPFDTGLVRVGTTGLEVRVAQAVDMASLKQVVAAGTEATIGRERPSGPGPMSDVMDVPDERWQEMFRGGLQAALESQTIVCEVWGASRILTHQLVRSRRAGFHQQSQRSTWYGDRPEVRMPETVWRAGTGVRMTWLAAYEAAWRAYSAACDAGVPYEDARYILPEGTVNYIQCEYTVREFINVFAYRGCSMFLREMVEVMRMMRSLLVEVNPELEPYIKISCEKGPEATRKCTFQGWENVELACDFPWAREDNRTFIAAPKLRIGAK